MSSALCRTWPTTLARTRTYRMTHGLTRTDSRDALAAHQVRQDPNGVNRARIAPAAQATGEAASFRASTSRITGEVRLVPRSAPEQTEDPTTQLTELVGRLVVLGHVDVGHDARGSLGQDDHPAGQAQCLVDVVGDQDRSEALGLP